MKRPARKAGLFLLGNRPANTNYFCYFSDRLKQTALTTLEQVYALYKGGAGICTDSRKLQPGDIFFALKGPNFNGNRFADKAVKDGAALVVVDEPETGIGEKMVLVPDVLSFLQQLGRHHRQQFDIPVIGIAGSNGKTTTKELMRAVLETSFTTFSTPGNFNNEIGVPLALLMIKPNVEAAVIEMGARHVGEIDELCQIAEPTIGLVTNTGKDHLETFKTLENTRKTNAELYKYVGAHGGTALVNSRYTDLLDEAKEVKQLYTYGQAGSNFAGSIKATFPYLVVTIEGEEEALDIHTKLVGKYNFENVMAAVAVGRLLHVPDPLIKKAIEAYTPSNNRSQLSVIDSNTFIMDAYNANPSSMAEALGSFEELQGDNKVVMLGDMLELGEVSEEEHLLVVLKLKQMNLSDIVLVGPEFGKVSQKLDCHHFNHVDEAREWFKQQAYNNTLFLLKGSRGIALEKILD